MNQELMTLDFWQDTVIYEGKTFPVGTLACDALNVPADTIAMPCNFLTLEAMAALRAAAASS